MKINISALDRIILTLLGYVVLVDMVNGFFAMELTKLPISQAFKFLLLLLFFVRMLPSRDLPYLLLLLFIFQLGPIMGWLKTQDGNALFSDVVVATKWFNVPLSFYYFKNLFQGKQLDGLKKAIHRMVRRSYIFLSINMFLGLLGLGMAFYNHGFSNAVGSRGYIYAGNELTILVLALAFIMGTHLYYNKKYVEWGFTFLVFMIISFLITSKTVLGGTILVFLIPVLSNIRFPIKRIWMERATILVAIAIPIVSFLFYFGISTSGIVDKIAYSMKRNDYDILTVALSNRNNFVRQGWEVYTQEYPFLGKLIGYGQQYHLQLSGHSAEVDFFSLLFASGILGLVTLLVLLLYWIVNAFNLSRIKGYGYARSVLVFVLFLTLVANLSGHIFGSGIAGIFIGMSIAIMFYKTT